MAGSADTSRDWSDFLKWPWIQENILWIIGALPVVLVGYRLFFVSVGDPVTLRLLVANLDVMQILMVTALTLLPIFLFYSSFVVMERATREVPGENLPGWTFSLVLIFLLIAAFTMNLVTLIGASTGIAIFFTLAAGYNFWRVRKRGLQRNIIFGGFLITFSVLQSFIASSTHWIPAENYFLSSGEKKSGYELTSDDESVTVQWILGGSARLDKEEIENRELCIKKAERNTLLFIVAPSMQHNPGCAEKPTSPEQGK
ncbi:hypothetical protein [Rhodococcus sp. 06-235-1A]|uniref:hypothetical protein n=1 Tax=Rhodococcus sp. 06-235-1A TaxID=2022508 RepID=UPI00117AC4B4|nr:hypothetical protein [Rhodococcus sp. 06-235-1A]